MELRTVASSEQDLLRRVAEIHVAVPALWWSDYSPRPGDADHTLAEDRGRLTDGSGAVLVAEDGGTLIGFARVFVRNGDDGHIASLWVDEKHRDAGVATALLDATGDWARAHGCDELSSEVHAGNPAMLGLSERYGFRPEWTTFTKPLRRA